MTPSQKLRSIADSTGLDGIANAIREVADEIDLAAVPEGFELVAVKGFSELMYWLERCENKGHLENCPDLVEPWAAFEYRNVAAPSQEPVTLTDEELEECFRRAHEQTNTAYIPIARFPIGWRLYGRQVIAALREKAGGV